MEVYADASEGQYGALADYVRYGQWESLFAPSLKFPRL
jgi:hypothetical protein